MRSAVRSRGNTSLDDHPEASQNLGILSRSTGFTGNDDGDLPVVPTVTFNSRQISKRVGLATLFSFATLV